MKNLANALAFIKTLINNDNLVNFLDSRVSNQQFQHFIHWCGYDVNEHNWEAIKYLSHAMEKMKKKIINNIQTSLRPSLFVKFIIKKGSNVTNTIFT
jgi:hypothetical protein